MYSLSKFVSWRKVALSYSPGWKSLSWFLLTQKWPLKCSAVWMATLAHARSVLGGDQLLGLEDVVVAGNSPWDRLTCDVTLSHPWVTHQNSTPSQSMPPVSYDQPDSPALVLIQRRRCLLQVNFGDNKTSADDRSLASDWPSASCQTPPTGQLQRTAVRTLTTNR